ncbi:MAG: biotin/lipoyl-binding protein [Propionibacteriaceae bacterium]|nr:biotin/lipoyl-binding protein [Propionibacteriaceae bacterium]
MIANSRLRAVAAAATALVVVAGVGITVASSSQAASSRYVTATAGTGDVVQTYTATGTITRNRTAEAAFTVDGTVKSVAVAVGDSVEAGDVLATLKKGPLQLAVLNAETAVAQAKASLYSAQHPSSVSSGSSSGGGSGSGGSGGATITIDPVLLNEAVARINLAVLTEAEKCEPVFGSILPAAEPTATPTATGTPTATASPTPSASATETTEAAEATPTASASPTASSQPEATAAEPTASASQLADTIEANDPTEAELQECANARAEVLAANTNLQAVVTLLTSPRPGGTSAAVKKASSSSTTSVSARQVAAAKADLLEAEQDLQSAEDDLAAATLVAPSSGTVGLVDLAKGDSAGSGSITIIGAGSAVVTVELPLKTRALVETGQEVTVTPAGATAGLKGRLTGISVLETSGTSGDSPTYAATVAVSDADQLLASGAKASVTIAVKSASGVLRLPASAVTPTGTDTATVQVLASASAETPSSVEVKTGAVGGGWVEITDGLDAGQLVVLADRTADIPANATRRRTTTTSTSAASAAASAQPTSEASTPASAQPTATATR